MWNLEATDSVFLIGPICLAVGLLVLLKILYTVKSPAPPPPAKPALCLLPKYRVTLPLQGSEDPHEELAARLALYGFRPVARDSAAFERGSSLGDFSIKIAKVKAVAEQPLTNPVKLRVEYGVAFGCAFDTGDLWKFCSELVEKVEVDVRQPHGEPGDTANPYQPPRV